MKIAMSGASGFVGTHLSKALREIGHEIIPIEREDFQAGPERVCSLLSGAGVIINLAGAPIITRWSESYKKVMYSSRVHNTRMIVDCIASGQQGDRPKLLISTSAVGIYAPGDRVHTEADNEIDDKGFLGRLARDWEAEAIRAEEFGVSTVVLRFGIVLSPEGGALAKMLPPFRLGLGGRVGSGRQYISWVHMDDLIAVFRRALGNGAMRGVYNLVSPCPVTNADFTRALGRALKRPALFRVPELVLRAQYGEGAQVLTEGQRVMPERLLSEGYEFLHEDIFESLECTLRRRPT